MVQLCTSVSDKVLASPWTRMQNGEREGGRQGVITNGRSTLPHQPWPKTAASRQDRNSCSSTSSCPVFSDRHSDQEEDDDPLPRCPSSLSSPSLRGSLSSLRFPTSSLRSPTPGPKDSSASLHASRSGTKGCIPSLLHSPAPSPTGAIASVQGSPSSLQGSLPSLRDSTSGLGRSLASLNSPSSGPGSSLPSPSPSLRCPSPQSSSSSLHSGSSSEDDSWDTNSWSSGATCLLRSSIKQHSQEVFQARAGSSGPPPNDMTSASDSENVYQNLDLSALGANDPGTSTDSHDEEVFPERHTGRREFPQPTALSNSRRESPQNKPIQPSHSRQDPTQNQATPPSHGSRHSMKSQPTQLTHCRHDPPQNQPNPPRHGSPVAPSVQLEQMLEDRIKFSQFLDEVAHRVLGSPFNQMDPTGLLTPPPSPASWYCPGSGGSSVLQTIKEDEAGNLNRSGKQWSWCLPSCKVLECGEELERLLQLGEGGLGKILPPGEGRLKAELKPGGEGREIQLGEGGLREELPPGEGGPRKELQFGLRRVQRESCYSEPSGKAYLETDIDMVRQQDALGANGYLGREKERSWDRGREREKERGREKERRGVCVSPVLSRGSVKGRRKPCPVFSWPEGYLRVPYRSTSLPQPVTKTDLDGKMHDTSSFHDHKEDLRKRLSYTTHKLEMVESEFDSTRQYLETELRRAQEELDKFTDKLRRIQSSYSTLQRINQDLEDKMHKTSQHHEEEKRALGREIIVLNNHLMEAKLTIEKLRDDNDLYRKDCNLAAQLLQCSKSHYRALSELPEDFQERVSTHIEKHGHSGGVTMAMCHSPYSEAVPTAVIAKVLEKPEPGSSCPVTRSPSPTPQDGDFLPNSMGTGSTDQLNRRTAYKTSDLYCSDTALYCPERWQDRRQSVDIHGGLQLHAQLSIDSNPDEEAFLSGSFSHARPQSFQASSSYSSFSVASDVEKGNGGNLGSTLSSSHQALYMDWRDDYDCKSTCSYDKDAASCYDKDSFPKSLSFQHMALPQSPQGGGVASPAYTRATSCFSEPYHPSPSPSPHLATSHSMGTASDLASPLTRTPPGEDRSSAEVLEEELTTRWRQLSVDELNSFSYPDLAQGGGRASPYSFSERHFALGPAKAKHGPLYSSFQEGDHVFLSFAGNPSPSPKLRPGHRKQEKGPLYRAEQNIQDSECSLFLLGSSKEKEGASGSVDVGRDSPAESLQPGSLEASSAQHYQRERPSSSTSARIRPNSSPRLSSGPRPSSSHSPRPSSSHNPRPSSSHNPRPSSSLGPALPKKTSPRYQKFGSAGLTRKDSLTKAQLYGTLLN